MFEFDETFKIVQKFWSDLFSQPQHLTDIYFRYWQEAIQFFQQPLPHSPDKRFQGSDWKENPFFHGLKEWYLFNAQQVKKIISYSTLDKKSTRKIRFLMEQWINALSPGNFLMTNPEVLKETLDTKGENLKKGWENFLKDMEKSKTQFAISMSDSQAFEVGKNLAVTPGKVIYQNDLMQLIQYLPATEKVYQIPLLIIPPWINKYYILDLQAHNSFVKWSVSQGITVFMISWVNPDQRHAEKTFTDYLQEGVLSALNAIETSTGEKQVNALGFCIGGTLLAVALAYAAHKKENAIRSATFLTTLVDFTDPGDIEVFIDEKQITALEKIMEKTGYLEGEYLSAAFNLLRSNELIWSYFINHYLKGKNPAPFDILYWNADTTNLPHKMQSQYLREMYLYNKLCEPSGMKIGGVPINLRKVKQPVYCFAGQQDHIAPWQSVFMGMQLFESHVRFVLGEAGHIVGVVNPPSVKKYGYRVNESPINTDNPETWLAGAQYYPQSWWNDWITWLSPHGGKKIAAAKRNPLQWLEEAPGSYVRVRL